ncbi:hypothetical protein ACJJTC_005392 [Scirpophaga incertulas]
MEDLKITMVALQEAFATRMAAFESDLKNSRSQSPTQVTALAGEIDAIEMRSRRNTLLLHGLPEVKDEEPTKTFFNAATEHLSGLKLSPDMVSRMVRSRAAKAGQAKAFVEQKLGVSNCWTKSGRIIAVGSDGKRHVVASIRDIDKLKPCSSSNSFGAHSDKTSATDRPVSSALGTKSKRVTSAKRK